MKIPYDDDAFFAQYAQMNRSRQGLEGAGEWHQLEPLFPPLNGSRVLDLGCGYGWHCAYAAQNGAVEVLGIDSSKKMIAEARRRNGGAGISYRVCALDDYEYPESRWDLVVSNLVLHYIADLEGVYRAVAQTLRPGGVFLFNIEHPVFTAASGQDWGYGPDGRPLYWPVDDYFKTGARATHFLGCEVVKQHHTLTEILMGLLRSGFVIEHVEEARPPQSWLEQPGMADELRRPMMLLVRAYLSQVV